jgi:hypothetical protein
MRSRVVPKRDIKEKFGAEVQAFRYAFVLPNHGSQWESAQTPPSAKPGVAPLPHPRRRATDKRPTFIEVHPRKD